MKQFLKNILYGICYTVRNILDPFCSFQEISILAYHSISDEALDTAISASEFVRQLEYLRDKGFSFVSLDTIVQWLEGEKEEKKISLRKAVALTFDDGYADFETSVLPILEKYSAPATLFVMGNPEAARSNLQNSIPLLSVESFERVRSHELIEIGFHSTAHANLGKLKSDALRQEISTSAINNARFFAYPGGQYSAEAVEEVKKAGYKAAFSIKRRLVKKQGKGSDRYLLPRTVVTHNMRLWQVGVHVTKAIDWYRAITSLVK